MAINQLQIPQANINSTADFTPLANLGNIYQKAQEDQRRREALGQLGQGQNADASTLIRSGDQGLAQLGLTLQNRLVDQGREDARYAVTDRRADTQLGLAQNADRRAATASERANMSPLEQAQERAQTADAYGFKPGTPEYNQWVFNGKMPDPNDAARLGLQQNADRRAAIAADRANMTPLDQSNERKAAALDLGLKPGTQEYNAYLLNGTLPDSATANRAGLSPIFGTRKNPATGQDEPVMLQTTGAGAAVETAMPPGVTISNKPIVQDLGTSFVYIDPVTRQIIKQVPKDLEGKARAEVVGEGQGKAALALPQVEANSKVLLNNLDTVLKHPGKQYALGMYSTLPTIPGTKQADFRAAVEQLKGGVFLQAYNTLRGGGAITEIEGTKAENALLRAQTAQTQEAFDQGISEYRAIVQSGIDRARNAARGGASTGQGDGADTVLARANAAIANGADPKAVRQRLIDAGVDPGNVGK